MVVDFVIANDICVSCNVLSFPGPYDGRVNLTDDMFEIIIVYNWLNNHSYLNFGDMSSSYPTKNLLILGTLEIV